MKYHCERCHIPKSCYDLKHEPSLGNPDFTMPDRCKYGHFWITTVELNLNPGAYNPKDDIHWEATS